MAIARWYVVHVHSGFEHKVAEYIREQAAKKGLEKDIEDILIPMEEVVEIKKGEKVTSEKKFFPGYVIVKMAMSDETWHIVRDTPKVSGFLGGKTKPSPVSQREVDKIMKQVEEGATKALTGSHYEIGDQVNVTDGPFMSFSGTVEEVDEEKTRLKVSVSIFGRATLVELEYTQVEKE